MRRANKATSLKLSSIYVWTKPGFGIRIRIRTETKADPKLQYQYQMKIHLFSIDLLLAGFLALGLLPLARLLLGHSAPL